MEIPLKLNNSLLVKYKPSSIKTFTINIKRILKEVYNIDKYTVAPLLNIKKVTDYITNDVQKISVQLNLAAALVSFLSHEENIPKEALDYYQNLFDKISEKAAYERKYPIPTEEELENWLPWSQIVKLANDYKKKVTQEPYDYLKYLVLSLYTQIPPLRGQDYLNSIIMKVENPTDYHRLLQITQKNIFDLTNKQLIISHYKTEKTHGRRTIDIPKQLIPIVENWFRITGSQNLIPNLQNKSEPMTQQAFTDLLFRIFKPKNISTSMLRKIYISHRLKYISNNPIERKKLARIMGHTLETQEFIYNRFKKMKK